MSSKWLMIASSIFLALMGVVASFAPSESLGAMGAPSINPLPLIVQLLGALYLAFAITNWTAKDNAIGGIYSRPLSLGNFLHFAVGTISLLKQPSARHLNLLGGVLVLYAIFAILFATLLFGQSPTARRMAASND